MLWRYIGLILSFALKRTTPAVDALQVLAASAIPAVARFAGLSMPANVSADALAYIGLAAIAFVAIKLFSAPFFIWKEQCSEIGQLKLTLSAPERLELESLAKRRAKVRLQISKSVGRMRWEVARLATSTEDQKASKNAEIKGIMSKAVSLTALLPETEALGVGLRRLNECVSALNKGNKDNITQRSNKICILLVKYLHGQVTSEALALQLPQGIELETPQ